MKKFLFIFLALSVCTDIYSKKPKGKLGGWAICKEVYEYIVKNLPRNKTILELGSGVGTQVLTKRYKLISIEHNPKWLNKYDSNYIYAPIKNSWYDIQILRKALPKLDYDLILVDGPNGRIGRYGFYENLKLFNPDVPIIFDDVDRKSEFDLMEAVSKKLNKSYKVYICSSAKGKVKKFGVISKAL